MYTMIFLSNVIRAMSEQGITKKELAKRAGCSATRITEITTGQANPSLRMMGSIAMALGKPLSRMLEPEEMDRKTADTLSDGKFSRIVPPGFEIVCVVLTSYQAFKVKEMAEKASQELDNLKNR